MYDSKNVGQSAMVSELSYSIDIKKTQELLESGDSIKLEEILLKDTNPLVTSNMEGATIVGVTDVRGIQAVAVKDNDGNITIGYRGTKSILDGITDLKLANGNFDYQYKEALNFYNKVLSQNPDAQITLTGHSLGGGLAQY